MKRLMGYAAWGLVVGAVLVAMATSAQSGERLPHMYRGHETIVIDLTTGNAEHSSSGEATHLGRFENVGTAQVDLQTMDYQGGGTVTAANGDQVFWAGTGNLLTAQMLITLTGGTGRFENVEGELDTWEMTNVVQTEEPGFLTLTFDAKGTGWIVF